METYKATKEDLICAKKKFKSAPDDRVGTFGTFASTGLAGGVGGAAAPSIATWFGASTILGSSTLGSCLSGILATTTPVGWVIGTSVIAAISAYGISKLIKSGGMHDQIRKQNVKDIESKILKLDKQEQSARVNDDFDVLREALRQAVSLELMPQEQADILLNGVEEKTIDITFALQATKELINDHNKTTKWSQMNKTNFDKQLEIRLTAILLKKMMTIDDIVKATSFDIFYEHMNKNFDLDKDDAENIFLSIPFNIDVSNVASELANVFDSKALITVYTSLLRLTGLKPDYFEETNNILGQIKIAVNNSDPKSVDTQFTKHALNIEDKQFDIDRLINKL